MQNRGEIAYFSSIPLHKFFHYQLIDNIRHKRVNRNWKAMYYVTKMTIKNCIGLNNLLIFIMLLIFFCFRCWGPRQFWWPDSTVPLNSYIKKKRKPYLEKSHEKPGIKYYYWTLRDWVSFEWQVKSPADTFRKRSKLT